MKQFYSIVLFGLIMIITTATIYAQFDNSVVIPAVRLEGPRVGLTYIAAKKGSELESRMKDMNLNPMITQFGWQFEKRFFTLENGTSGLVESVLLLGGMEQSKLLPSGSFLVGLRSGKGLEVGVGPNLSISGVAYVIAFGYTATSKYINFPFNFAIVPSASGVRFTILVGFNARKE